MLVGVGPGLWEAAVPSKTRCHRRSQDICHCAGKGGRSSAEAQTERAKIVPHGKELQMFQKINQC